MMMMMMMTMMMMTLIMMTMMMIVMMMMIMMIHLTTLSYSDQLLEGPTTSPLTAINMMIYI